MLIENNLQCSPARIPTLAGKLRLALPLASVKKTTSGRALPKKHLISLHHKKIFIAWNGLC